MGWNELPLCGWMYSSLQNLRQNSDFNFAIATVYPGSKLISKEIEGVRYFLLPLCGKSMKQYNPHLEVYWQKIAREFAPDVVHIHGSEYPHGLAYVNAIGASGVVVSLQGILSGIARHYPAGIDFRNVKKCLSLRDLIRHDGLRYGQKEFEKRGEIEKELLSKVNHIIGRTEWDKAHVWAMNPNANYHYCGETLRKPFYLNKWNYENCIPHSIFISQAGYSLKGLHKLLEAMPLILNHFPDTKITVAGDNPTGAPWWRITGYGKYLKNLIRRLNLSDHIEFAGMLQEDQMCQAYLRANVFVCPSSIENSPNSLGEAQLLGMPYVASFAGGVPEIVNGDLQALYRFEETEMLAKKVCGIFEVGKDYKAPLYDQSRYDRDKNTADLIDIYTKISNPTDFK
ncbi:MAG: glycosyltransferase family 4 protein [Muribaculum sp.]|nr:glycosyltransferase family 4 protein [Muribaculum sp.]